MKEKYLTINDVCSLMKVSRQSVNNWRKDGLIKANNINGRVVFSEADIKALPAKRMPPGRRRKEISHG